jgi:hypothetical protein
MSITSGGDYHGFRQKTFRQAIAPLHKIRIWLLEGSSLLHVPCAIRRISSFARSPFHSCSRLPPLLELHEWQTRIALSRMSGPPQDRGRMYSKVSGPFIPQ